MPEHENKQPVTIVNSSGGKVTVDWTLQTEVFRDSIRNRMERGELLVEGLPPETPAERHHRKY